MNDEDGGVGDEDNPIEYKINRVQPSERINKPKLPMVCGDSASGILIDSDASRSYYLQSVQRRQEEEFESGRIHKGNYGSGGLTMKKPTTHTLCKGPPSLIEEVENSNTQGIESQVHSQTQDLQEKIDKALKLSNSQANFRLNINIGQHQSFATKTQIPGLGTRTNLTLNLAGLKMPPNTLSIQYVDSKRTNQESTFNPQINNPNGTNQALYSFANQTIQSQRQAEPIKNTLGNNPVTMVNYLSPRAVQSKTHQSQGEYIKKMLEKEQERVKKIEDQKNLKEEKEKAKLTFQPQINERSQSRGKRTLNAMIEDLYTKPVQQKKQQETHRSESRGTKKSLNPGVQGEVFERLYKGAVELNQKKTEAPLQSWRNQKKQLFSPKITQMAKDVKKRPYISPREQEEEIQENKANIFELLSEDAQRRKKEQELTEIALNQHKPYNLVSENSIKILCKKLMTDFNEALYQVAQIYSIPDSESYELSEEQFASVLAAMGFFKNYDLEQTLYDDLISLCTSKNTNTQHLSIRNVKVVILAIYNIGLDWMSEQDKAEWEGFYHRRIQKYRLIKEKLQVFIADQSEALKYSCQETPLSLPQTHEELLTEDERAVHMESPTLLGIGIFKGMSLCLTVQDTAAVHLRFKQLHKNKVLRDQDAKTSRANERKEQHQLIPNETTFSPRISNRSNELAKRAKSREGNPRKSRENSTEHYEAPKTTDIVQKTLQMRTQLAQKIAERIKAPEPQQPQRTVNVARINQLYEVGKQKMIKRQRDELIHQAKKQEQELSKCTFQPTVRRSSSRKSLTSKQGQQSIPTIESMSNCGATSRTAQPPPPLNNNYFTEPTQPEIMSPMAAPSTSASSHRGYHQISQGKKKPAKANNENAQPSSHTHREELRNKVIKDKPSFERLTVEREHTYAQNNSSKPQQQPLQAIDSTLNIQKQSPSVDLTNKSIPFYKQSEDFDEPMTVITPSHDVSMIGGGGVCDNHQRTLSLTSHKKGASDATSERVLKDTTSEQINPDEEDEVLIVEVQLGSNVKTQLQIARSQNVDEVSQQFCKTNQLSPSYQKKVSSILRNVIENYYQQNFK